MRRLVEDLRFVIGLFFGLVGLLLEAVCLVADGHPDATRINAWSGLVMLVFAAFMLALSVRRKA